MNALTFYGLVFASLLVWASVSARPLHSTASSNATTTPSGHEKVTIEVATFDFQHVAWPFMIMVWILVASFAKLGKTTKSASVTVNEQVESKYNFVKIDDYFCLFASLNTSLSHLLAFIDN